MSDLQVQVSVLLRSQERESCFLFFIVLDIYCMLTLLLDKRVINSCCIFSKDISDLNLDYFFIH